MKFNEETLEGTVKKNIYGHDVVLDKVSEYIKKLEQFLDTFPITESRSYNDGIMELIFSINTKRILLRYLGDNEAFPLLNIPVSKRVLAFHILPRFAEEIIREELSCIDADRIRDSAKKLCLIMGST